MARYLCMLLHFYLTCTCANQDQAISCVCLSVILLVLENHKTLCLALEYIKNGHSGVLFIALGGSVDQILVQTFTKFDSVRITTCTVEGLSFHVSCFAAVV